MLKKYTVKTDIYLKNKVLFFSQKGAKKEPKRSQKGAKKYFFTLVLTGLKLYCIVYMKGWLRHQKEFRETDKITQKHRNCFWVVY